MAAWVIALVAGGAAQAIKLALALVQAKTITPRTFLNLPGMPSTWAAMCGGMCSTIGAREGLHSAALAAAVAFSSLVLYDALKLRRTAGRQARLLKSLATGLDAAPVAARQLRTLLGENPLQVAGGLAVGAAVAWLAN
jgi:hypothetical protein